MEKDRVQGKTERAATLLVISLSPVPYLSLLKHKRGLNGGERVGSAK